MNETTMVAESTEQKVNKSKLIFSAFETQGLDVPAQELVTFIKETTKVDVTVSLINNLRSKVRKKKAEKKMEKMRRDAAKKPQAPQEVQPRGDDPFDKLLAVKEFAAKMGGLAEVKTLIQKLETLSS